MTGTWMCVHPEWRGVLLIKPDGTTIRPQTGMGRWQLVTDKPKPDLLLIWDVYGTERLHFITSDHFQIRLPRGDFNIYRVPPPPTETPSDSDPVQKLRERLKTSVWRVLGRTQIILQADGTVTSNRDERKGTWRITSPTTLEFDVPWPPKPAKVVAINPDATVIRWTDDDSVYATRQHP